MHSCGMPPEAETLPKTAGTAMGAGRKSYPGTPDFAKDGGSAGNPVGIPVLSSAVP